MKFSIENQTSKTFMHWSEFHFSGRSIEYIKFACKYTLVILPNQQLFSSVISRLDVQKSSFFESRKKRWSFKQRQGNAPFSNGCVCDRVPQEGL